MDFDSVTIGETYRLSPTHFGYQKDDFVVEVLRKGATKIRVRTRMHDRMLWVFPDQLEPRGRDV